MTQPCTPRCSSSHFTLVKQIDAIREAAESPSCVPNRHELCDLRIFVVPTSSDVPISDLMLRFAESRLLLSATQLREMAWHSCPLGYSLGAADTGSVGETHDASIEVQLRWYNSVMHAYTKISPKGYNFVQ